MQKISQFAVAGQILLLLGTHLYFTFRLKFIQRKIPQGIRLSFSDTHHASYTALATALAATIGTGNIIGISTAIAIGGAGAVFWCWITGVLGIATCYGECFLSMKYRKKEKDGRMTGGPMYVLEIGMKKKGLAVLFSVFTILASLGIGSSVQAHSISAAVTEQIGISPHIIGIAAGVLAGKVIIGGSRQIGKVCTWLVPVMSAFYLGGCIFILIKNHTVVPEAVKMIVTSAFVPEAAAGGVVGTTVMAGLRTGISRGLFTNEAGLGSIPMAAATAQNVSLQDQALVSMTGPFWDTVVMCAITGIASVSSMIAHPGNYVGVSDERMCFAVFRELPVWGDEMLSLSLVLFAFATIIGWNVYGECAVRYLFGENSVRIYQVIYMFCVYLGAVITLDVVWGISDIFNFLMAVPNLLCLWGLRRKIEINDRKIKH